MANRKNIPENTKRKLWSSSLGQCGNPDCETKLFDDQGKSIGQMAHIEPHSKNQNDEFNNLILLCCNCHNSADKAKDYQKLQEWKDIQEKKFQELSSKKFSTFDQLEKEVKPILEENKAIYEHYYLEAKSKKLWDKFEPKLLANNGVLIHLFKKNIELFQGSTNSKDSNADFVQQFIRHAEEFEATREEQEKFRQILFPEEINSIFGISQIKDRYPVSNVDALQKFLKKLVQDKRLIELSLTDENPFIKYKSNSKDVTEETLYLNDYPRVRQIYWSGYFYKKEKPGLRLENLVFFLKWLKNNQLSFKFIEFPNLSYIQIKNKYKIKLVYLYYLCANEIEKLSPERGLHIVNLYNFNGDGCISLEAREKATAMEVGVYTTNQFYQFAHNKIKENG